MDAGSTTTSTSSSAHPDLLDQGRGPAALRAWETGGIVPRDIWLEAGKQRLPRAPGPAELRRGGAPDWRFNAVLNEDSARRHPRAGLRPAHRIVVPYLPAFGTDEQRARWLPGMASGELIGAIAMTEPGTGSDLAAVATSRAGRRRLDLNGTKTFISNGILADLVVVVVRTDPTPRHGGLSLLVVERGADGFTRGRNLDKMGMHAQDTAELHFSDVRVPAGPTCSASGAALRPPHGQPRPGAAGRRRRWPRQRTGGPRADAGLRQGAHAFGTRSGPSRRTASRWPRSPPSCRSAQVYVDRCVELHCAGSSTPSRPPWRSGGSPTCRRGHRRLPAAARRATATWRSTRSRGPAGTPACSGSTRGTNEIMKEIIGRSMGV